MASCIDFHVISLRMGLEQLEVWNLRAMDTGEATVKIDLVPLCKGVYTGAIFFPLRVKPLQNRLR